MFGVNIEQRRLQILAEMEEYANRLLHEMSGVDKETLKRMREIVSDYYNARANILLLSDEELKRCRDTLEVLKRAIVDDVRNIRDDLIYPEITDSDEGKFMRVLDGKWQAVGLLNAEEVLF